jgi:hypothetical protein
LAAKPEAIEVTVEGTGDVGQPSGLVVLSWAE